MMISVTEHQAGRSACSSSAQDIAARLPPSFTLHTQTPILFVIFIKVRRWDLMQNVIWRYQNRLIPSMVNVSVNPPTYLPGFLDLSSPCWTAAASKAIKTKLHLTSQAPFILNFEHKKEAGPFFFLLSWFYFVNQCSSYKIEQNGALNKQVENVGEWSISWEPSASVIFIKVLLALWRFGAPCWFGHDDLKRKKMNNFYQKK